MSQEITRKFIKCHNVLIETGKVHNSSVLAKKLGVFRQFLSKIVNGKAQVTLEMLQKMIDLFHVNPNFLFSDDSMMFLNPEKKKPNIEFLPGLAFAGEIIQFQNEIAEKDLFHFTIPGTRFENGEYRAFIIQGDSMEPYFYNGNLVVCSRLSPTYYDRQIKTGGIYVIMTQTEILIKRFNGFPSRNQLSFKSDNTSYQDILLAKEEIKEILKVEGKFTEDIEMHHFKNEIDKLNTIIDLMKGKS